MKNRTTTGIAGAVIIILIALSRLFHDHFDNKNDHRAVPHLQPGTTHAPIQESDFAHQQVIPADAHLVYTKHARCRMDCRHITEDEIREVLQDGHVNEEKSNPSDTPCPTYAIEDDTREGQKLRIVFAKCDNEVKVVTCIDRGKEFECDCK
ncbi:DUF4258 domain-containing protein [Chitinophagaceae bacterium MMS25-I14]